MKTITVCMLLILFPFAAQAYTGPGLGTGVIGVVLGILASIGLALIAFIWYPLKRLFKRLANKKETSATTHSEE